MTGKEFKLMSRKERQWRYSCPIVYVWKRSDLWLYVGSSHEGWQRLCSHNILGYSIWDNDTIQIHEFDETPRGLNRIFERGMIKKNNPLLNSIQGRGNQQKKARAKIYREII